MGLTTVCLLTLCMVHACFSTVTIEADPATYSAGQPVNVICKDTTATGLDALEFKKGADKYTTAQSNSKVVFTSGTATLTIDSFAEEDAATYSCGSTTPKTLTLKYITIEADPAAYSAGQRVQVICKDSSATGLDALEFKKGADKYTTAQSNSKVVFTSGTATLTIDSFAEEDAATYSCGSTTPKTLTLKYTADKKDKKNSAAKIVSSIVMVPICLLVANTV